MLALATVGVVVAVIAAALSIDLGSQALKNRDLQKIADLAALDATWVIPEIGHMDPGDSPTLETQQAARDSARRNGLTLEPPAALRARLGEWDTNERDFNLCGMFLSDLEVTLLGFDPDQEREELVWSDGGHVLADADIGLLGCEPNAVMVRAEDVAARYFMPGGDSVVVRSAGIAWLSPAAEREEGEGGPGTEPTADALAATRVGSFVARHDSATSPILNRLLSALVGGQVTLDAVSYQGIAQSNFTLGELAGQLTGGSVEALLDADLTISELVSAMATVLSNQDPPVSATVTSALGQIASASTGVPGSKLLEVISVGGGHEEEAAQASVNALNTLMSAAHAANGGNALTFDLDASPLPLVQTARVTVALIEPPVEGFYPGSPVARTAQLRFRLELVHAELLQVVLSEGGLLGGVLSLGQTQVTVPMVVEVGRGQATITGVECPADPLDRRVDVHALTAPVHAAVGLVTAEALLEPEASAGFPGLEVGEVASISALGADVRLLAISRSVSAGGEIPPALDGAEQSLAFFPTFDDQNTQTIAAGDPTELDLPGVPNLAVPLSGNLTVSAEASLLGVSTSITASTQTGLISRINDLLATGNEIAHELSAGLGVLIGGADVTTFEGECFSTSGSDPTDPPDPVERYTHELLPILVK